MLFWILLALLALFLGLGYYVMNLAVKGRRYTKEALAAQLDKPAYREIKETSLASIDWVASHEHEELHVMSYDGKLLHVPPQGARKGHNSAVPRLQVLLADRFRPRPSLLLRYAWLFPAARRPAGARTVPGEIPHLRRARAHGRHLVGDLYGAKARTGRAAHFRWPLDGRDDGPHGKLL